MHPDGAMLFPEFERDSWYTIDSLMPLSTSTSDKDSRYFLGPKWNQNSCAADVVVFAALQLNIGVSHIEQMGENGINALSIPALTLRGIISRALERISEEGRVALVAQFRGELSHCDPANLAFGAMCDIRDMMYLAF